MRTNKEEININKGGKNMDYKQCRSCLQRQCLNKTKIQYKNTVLCCIKEQYLISLLVICNLSFNPTLK